jgi:hypothetical protein
MVLKFLQLEVYLIYRKMVDILFSGCHSFIFLHSHCSSEFTLDLAIMQDVISLCVVLVGFHFQTGVRSSKSKKRKGFTFTRHDPRTEHGTETRLRRALPTPCDTIAKSIRIKPRGNHNENEQIPRDSHGTAYSDSEARRPISRRARAWRQEMSRRGRRRQAQHCGGGSE